MPTSAWEFWIDVGGTFTDCLGRRPDGQLLRHKLLSSGVTKGTVGAGSTPGRIVDPLRGDDPGDFWTGFRFSLFDGAGQPIASSEVAAFDTDHRSLTLTTDLPGPLPPDATYELACDLEAPVIGIRYLLGLPLASAVPALRLRLGTTRGTNALLTRTGARTALVTTRGFGDMLEIGYQDRPRLFDLTVRKPPPLADRVVEIDERVAADGEVLIPLDRDAMRQPLKLLRQEGVESLAICLLHADLYPAHERQVAEIAEELGFREISCSSEVAPLVKIVARGETTVVDAYLNPVLRDYVAQLQEALPESQIRLMTSSGGLVAATAFRGHQSVLSGPAGGVVGYAQVARAAGFGRAIGFDMGGTSTDVSRFDGELEFEFESRKAGVRLVTSTLAIETVAAGGGSICGFDGAKLTVGPMSAGADPGPACYGRGGPLCVTDLNLWLGRIAVDRFPFSLDRSAVEKQLAKLADQVQSATGDRLTHVDLAEGLLRIAGSNMARAVRSVSVAKGVDPADYVLVAFGGAGAQHGCAISTELGIRRILIPPDAGILSAYGIGQADVVRHAVVGIGQPVTEMDGDRLMAEFDELAAAPTAEVASEGIAPERIVVRRSLDLCYEGTDSPLNLPFADGSDLVQAFESLHRRRFGYVQHQRPIKIVAARVDVVGPTGRQTASSTRCAPRLPTSTGTTRAHFGGEETPALLFDYESLQPGVTFDGPAIVAHDHSTIVVEPGWQAEMLSGGEMVLSMQDSEAAGAAHPSASSAVMLEVFNNLLAGIAEQMGHVLRRTAGSVNVKERLDYSCAVFDAAGQLVANAPHVPVHLGAMGATIHSLLADEPCMSPGDVFVSNDPYRGGSHLPDVTVVTPVHDPQSGVRLFFTACRAHHAEIGGVRPGSMPPGSQSLAEEGVLISNFGLVRNGASREAKLRELLSQAPYPSRRVEENLADIRAQVAANQRGASELLELVARYTLPVVEANMQGIQQAAESKVRAALSRLPQGEHRFADFLETADGTSVPIQVSMSLNDKPNQPAATIDFASTSGVVAGNLNANRAIVTAAVLYVLRLLVDEDIPLNEGALRAVDVRLPEGLLNPPIGPSPETTPALAAGNVETSQRVVDVLLGALGLAGASQGTMNNVLFGDDSFGYYETICGGSGATAVGPGADAVQVHMTNTRATDPEVLERRHPVRLWEFSIRRGSGGAGRHRGGDGVVRRLEFLAPLELSLITQRRGPHPPYGAAGGQPGSLGKNELLQTDGKIVELPGMCERSVEPGDVLVVKTPGGGGYGPP